MRWQSKVVFVLSFAVVTALALPARAQGIFSRKADKQEQQAQGEEQGLFSAFKKKEPAGQSREKDELKTAHRDAKTDLRAYKKERKAAEAREEAARARAEAIKAQRRAERAEGKVEKADSRAVKAREKADEKKGGGSVFRRGN